MLTAEARTSKLTRVGPETLIGGLMRQYRSPVVLSSSANELRVSPSPGR